MTATKPDLHETKAEPDTSPTTELAAERTPDGAAERTPDGAAERTPDDGANRPDRPQLSATQVVASVLAAITATLAASYLGVAGTVIGAAVASVLTVVGNAVYGHSIQRTGERVRAAVPASARWLPPVGSSTSSTTTTTSGAKHVEWRDRTHHSADSAPLGGRARLKRLGLACLAVFAVINVAITGVELIAGRPISDLLTGKQASGTTLFGTHDAGGATTPSPTTTVTVTPSVVVTTPTVTQTAPPVTSTVTPTVTSTPSPSPSVGSTSAPGTTPGTP
jgi:hypothetical protein